MFNQSIDIIISSNGIPDSASNVQYSDQVLTFKKDKRVMIIILERNNIA